MVPDCHRIHSGSIGVRPSPKVFTSDWFTPIAILATCAAIAVPLALLGEHGGRTILRAGHGKELSSASAPDSPDDEGYDILSSPSASS